MRLPTPPRRWLLLIEVAELMNIPPSEVEREIRAKGTEFPRPYRFTRRTFRWDSQEIEAFIEKVKANR